MQNQKYRSPVVVVLGHVDHGKTTLLDNIRKSNVAGKEVGAITQSIGAYQVKVPITGYHTDTITFIDTPGHQVFSQLRLRGAQVADIAILIIDGVDSVMPQTIESIAHIKQADIPFIVAVNKTDLPSANIEKVKKDLLKHEVLVEGMGGKIALIPISAKTGKGVNDLLEAILYISSNRGYTYDPSAEPQIYVIETQKLKSGPSVSCIIKEGQISVGNIIFNADTPVKIKALIDDLGKNIDTAIPSNVTTAFVQNFGNVIDSYPEYKDFLFGAEERADPGTTETKLPIKLSQALFSDAENLGRKSPDPSVAMSKTPETVSVGRPESGITLSSTTKEGEPTSGALV